MTLSSRQLVDLYATPYADNGLRGKAEAALRFAGRNSTGMGSALSPSQAAHLRDLGSAPAPARRSYDNPVARPTKHTRNGDPLTAVDIAWIQRLPADPKDVSYDDARTLAGMLDGSWDANSPDRRLVTSVLDPIRRLHNGREAEAALANHRDRGAPSINRDAALDLLRAALRREVPAELTDEEVAGRAASMLQDALAKAQAQRDGDRQRLEANVAAAERPFNVADAQANPAYAKLVESAAMNGDPAAGRARRDLHTARAEAAPADAVA